MPLNLLNEQVYYEHGGNPSWDLVILDEAHHARRQSPQNRKETPNRWLQLMQQLKEKSREANLSRRESLLLLSATPIQINTIEVFDLLQLLKLRGHWSYGKNFGNYLSTWHLNYSSPK